MTWGRGYVFAWKVTCAPQPSQGSGQYSQLTFHGKSPAIRKSRTHGGDCGRGAFPGPRRKAASGLDGMQSGRSGRKVVIQPHSSQRPSQRSSCPSRKASHRNVPPHTHSRAGNVCSSFTDPPSPALGPV